MPLCLFEDEHVPHLRPLVETRAAYDLRLGRRTLAQTARDAFAGGALGEPLHLALHARPLVAGVTRQMHPDAHVGSLPDGDVLFVNGRLVADGPVADRLARAVADREDARLFVQSTDAGDVLVGAWLPATAAARLPDEALEAEALEAATFDGVRREAVTDATLVRHPWDLLGTLDAALRRDFKAAAGPYNILDTIYDRQGADVHPSVVAIRPEHILLSEGVNVKAGAVLSAEDGPIHLGPGTTVGEQAVVRGPLYLGAEAQVRIGANVGSAAFGPWCKIGGEVHSTVVQGYTNKAHAGFLGHSVLGQWCNLGADTNNSNLKNDYGPVSAYDPAAGALVDTGRQFAGLFMGDHGKAGINTMFNTGTVVGTNCNVYGGGFPPRYVPPFSWGSPDVGFAPYRLGKALRVAETMMARRDVKLTDADRTLLTTLFEQTEDERIEG